MQYCYVSPLWPLWQSVTIRERLNGTVSCVNTVRRDLLHLSSLSSTLFYPADWRRPGWTPPTALCALVRTQSWALLSQSDTGWSCHLGRGFRYLSCRWSECCSHSRLLWAPEELLQSLQRKFIPLQLSIFFCFLSKCRWCNTPWSSLLTVVYWAAKSARAAGVSGTKGGTWSTGGERQSGLTCEQITVCDPM